MNPATMAAITAATTLMMMMMIPAYAGDTNPVFDPCADAKVQKHDGFTFGLAFSARNSFFFNSTQLSPCDSRLALAANGADLAVFRPKVDEISLLTINSSTFNPSKSGGYMVAFAGRKYAARSLPIFVADANYIVTSFTMVLEFQKGTLQNLYWKKFGCGSCTGGPFVCLNSTDCAIKNSNCRSSGGTTACDVGIQLAFSGTDKNDDVLNSWAAYAGDTNPVFDSCTDAKVQKHDGFTFGLAFAPRNSFFFDNAQLSPCDSRLSLHEKGADLALFRPQVDEISLLTINTTTLNSSNPERYMVVFAGRKYAARSLPIFVADTNYTVTSFTLVLEFQKGTLQNLFWKTFGCSSCTGSPFVCLNNTDCAIKNSDCKSNGGSTACDIGIQLAFSGTDKNDNVLNSWYEAGNLRQYSLFGLYSDLRNSLTGLF
ncbi:Expp1 protein [Perilla frutescens var. hirtella]|nr:Expp1 protein [Perilla frutescens var. hirtella]